MNHPPTEVSATPPMSDQDARRQYKLDNQRENRRKRGVQPLRLAPCGTTSAYRRHLRNHEVVDQACRDAWNLNAKEYRERRKKR